MDRSSWAGGVLPRPGSPAGAVEPSRIQADLLGRGTPARRTGSARIWAHLLEPWSPRVRRTGETGPVERSRAQARLLARWSARVRRTGSARVQAHLLMLRRWSPSASRLTCWPRGALACVRPAARGSDGWSRVRGAPRVVQVVPGPVQPSRVEARLLGPVERPARRRGSAHGGQAARASDRNSAGPTGEARERRRSRPGNTPMPHQLRANGAGSAR